MSLTLQECYDLHDIRFSTRETKKELKSVNCKMEELKSMNRKMDKQIALLEQMVAILTKIEERRTDADY